MNKVFSLFGLVIIVAIPARAIWTYGGLWEFGPHGIPMIALSPGGTTYRDGSELDPITAAITRSGMEEAVWGCALGVLLALFAWLACEVRRRKYLSDLRARRKQTNALLALSKRYEQAGRWQEAQRAFDSFRQSVETEMALWLSRRSTRRLLERAWKETHKANSDGAARAGRK